jgi:2,3-bisphosphoglycerate-independent phosphoglycerate mutase
MWGTYISRLDNTVRGLFNDLAISRAKRKQIDSREALLVSLDDVLKKFAKNEQNLLELNVEKKRSQRTLLPRTMLLRRWKHEYPKLRQVARRRTDVEKAQDP